MTQEQLMSIREHLSELKKRFKIAFISFVALLVAFLIVPVNPFSYSSYSYQSFTPIVAFFIARMKLDLLPPHWVLIAIHLNEPLEIYIVASVLLAMIFNSPIFAYEVVKFIGPALNERERKIIYPFVGATSGLFAFGVLFGYLFLAKFLLVALSPFFNLAGINPPTIDASDFYFVMLLSIAMSGIAFTVPVYIYTLIRFGVVQASTFRKNRLIIWAATYILTAIITPDGGPLLDIILFLPIITLLELAVFLGGRSRAREDKRNREEAAATTALATTTPTSTTTLTVSETPPSPVAPAGAPSAPAAGSVRVCAYCRSELTPGSVFCPVCGRANE